MASIPRGHFKELLQTNTQLTPDQLEKALTLFDYFQSFFQEQIADVLFSLGKINNSHLRNCLLEIITQFTIEHREQQTAEFMQAPRKFLAGLKASIQAILNI